MGWKSKAGAGIVAVGLAALFFCAPYYTVYSMRQAVREHDAEALGRRVDFPALRESLKANLNAGLLSGMREQPDNPFVGFGLLLGSRLVNGAVDGLVTPEGLAALMRGRASAAAAVAPFHAGVGGSDREEQADSEPKTTMSHVGLNEFVVSMQPKAGGEPLVLIYRRHGFLTWKLSAVRLPRE